MSHAAQSLFLKYLYPQKDVRILALEGGHGWLANQVAQLVPDGEVLSLARDIREVREAQTRLTTIPNATATQEVFPSSGDWDIVLLTIPKGRRYARTLLLSAWGALKPGGMLFLAGPTKSGAKAVIKDAKRLFGNANVLGYRSHQRVAACTRGEAIPEPLPKEFQQPGIAPGSRQFIEVDRPEGTLKLETHPGIFSWETLDEGTALLLEHLAIEPDSRVWDVGCGYGVIGLSAAFAGAGFVTMSDVNLIAVDYTQRNAVTNQMNHKVEIFAADTLSLPHQHPGSPPSYDLIISNPAFHQGRTVDRSMAAQLISGAPDFLTKTGRLLIVANRFLNYDKLMRPYFEQVARTAETSKFHLIEARNR
jgi:16S rRNA (guanine1207-N2)-methyltransferase